MIATNTDLKRWTILEARTNKILDLTDKEFGEGVESNYITLRGQYIEVENQKRVWIDGVIKR